MIKAYIIAVAGLVFGLGALTTHAMAGDSDKAYWACSQHPKGGKCEHFESLEEAQKSLEQHKKTTGHTKCVSKAGKCPY